jgi:hypothetical protein
MLGALSVIAPFYVAAGFALYLGRRTDLEAWDLELRFRRALLMRRADHAKRPGPRRLGGGGQAHPELRVALLALLLFGAIAPPETAHAQPADPEQARALIAEVLAEDDFGSTRNQEIWVYIGDSEPDQTTTNDASTTGLPLELILAIAKLLKWLLAVAALAALLLLAYRLWLELRGLRLGTRARKPDAEAAAAPISDGAATFHPLPDDISAAVRALLAAGDARGALSLLYRAQIAHLRASGLDIPDSATEADCLEAAARAATADQIAWLERLTGLWQRVAYAHRRANPAEITGLLDTHPAIAASAPAA